ncbi:MAG: DUF6371 domain-containing protein [Bacteroidetes bacterium]|nr:DUF6371 domain-containing protein [Bacteroidota bacterium]
MEYRYILEPYKNINSRHLCPSCGKNELTMYLDTNTNEAINPKVGRCNRESNCGYNYTPKQYFIDNKIIVDSLPSIATRMPLVIKKPSEIGYIDTNIFKLSLTNYDNNNFILFLISKFGDDIAMDLIEKYFIGTSKKWKGATVFYQIDTKGKIRAGKIMLYDITTGKRVKEPHDHITWLHSLLKLTDFSLSQSLFGIHLIKDKSKAIAIAESEKTAIIASIYLPQFIWLATGGKQNMKAEFFSELQGRNVVFFPDLKCFDLWSEKAKTLGLKNYSVSDLLETKANETEKKHGLDIADYLLKYNYQNWRLKELIELQFKKLNSDNWILNKEKNLQLTNYNLQVLCDDLFYNYNFNVIPEDYYNTFITLN